MTTALKSRVAVVVGVMLLCALTAAAQSQSRSLTGKVFDNSSNGIPKAIVYLKNSKTLVIKTYIADQDGSYHFPGLSPNQDYEVYAEHQGKRSDSKVVSSFDTRNKVLINLKIDK